MNRIPVESIRSEIPLRSACVPFRWRGLRGRVRAGTEGCRKQRDHGFLDRNRYHHLGWLDFEVERLRNAAEMHRGSVCHCIENNNKYHRFQST